MFLNRSLLLLCGLTFCLFSSAQGRLGARPASDSTEEKNFNFVPVPYVNYNRTTEFEYGLLPMFMYKLNPNDSISPKSISGAIAVNTTNQTSYLFAFNKLFFKQDKYRLTLAVGTGDYNAQVYVSNVIIPGDFFDFTTRFSFVNVGIERRVWKNLFLGFGYLYVDTESEIEGIEEFVSDNQLNGLFFTANNDERDDVYFPTSGSLGSLRINSYPEWIGNDQSSDVYNLSYNRYLTVRKDIDVLAIRGSIEAVFGDVNFEQELVVGGREIRGYTEGKYRGEQIVNLQAEYRWMPLDKIGFVGFGSVSKLFGSEIDKHNEYWYPGVGAGFRYLVIKENKMRVGLDYALGLDDWGVYFKIGETF